jgi:hypothetical protein
VSVSIGEIIAGASVHAVPLAGECAGYLVLAAADQALSAPRRIGPGEVRLFDDGTVRVEGARAADETDSEGDLRALLDALLLRASSATPALLRASRRAPGRGILSLVREIETALIPVNRAAAHRALARLERETERARRAGRFDPAAPVAPSASEPVRAEAPAVRPQPEPEPSVSVDALVETADEAADEIPSLFAPPVAAIAAYAAEIETRPEPIVVRRSAVPPPLPPRTPSPAPARTTPVFGTVVQSDSDDEVDIEVVLDDDLLDDELTGVLVRSAPLEISAMLEAQASPDPTEPCPPALEDEPSVAPGVAEAAAIVAEDEPPPLPSAEPPLASEASHPEITIILAEAAMMPGEPLPAEAAEIPSEPNLAQAAEAPSGAILMETAEAPPEPILVETAKMPPVTRLVETAEMPPEAILVEAAEMPPETHGETVALALSIEPVAPEAPPVPRLPMPKPRPSDVEDLLERMTQASVGGADDLRSSLKGMAGLEPTPPPPSQAVSKAASHAAPLYKYTYKYT